MCEVRVMSRFFVYSTLNNKRVEDALSARVPGLVFTKDAAVADAALLVARSERAGVGVPHVVDYLCLAGRMPVAVIAPGAEAEAARRHGVPDGNIIVPEGSVRLDEVAALLRRLVEQAEQARGRTAESGSGVHKGPPEKAPKGGDKGPPGDPEGAGTPLPEALRAAAASGHVCALFGVKGGVGTSTVAAALASLLQEHGAVHFELADTPGAWHYYGRSPEEALRTGRYVALGWGSGPAGAGVLLADVSRDAPVWEASAALLRAGCRVMVADPSGVSLWLTDEYVRAGAVPDVLVISRTVPGIGYGAEVYAGEFEKYGVGRVVSFPAAEKAVLTAQRRGIGPCGMDAELDAAAGELAAAVLAVLQEKSARFHKVV